MVDDASQHRNLIGIRIDAQLVHDPRHGWNGPGNLARSLVGDARLDTRAQMFLAQRATLLASSDPISAFLRAR